MTEHPPSDRSARTNAPFARAVPKPWGHELIFTPAEKPYCGKLLHVQAGQRLSLQVHDEKQETIMLLHGRAILLVDNARGELEEIMMALRWGYSILPGQRHRLIALEDSDFVEASTPERGVTYRLEDDSNRAHETEALRAQERDLSGT